MPILSPSGGIDHKPEFDSESRAIVRAISCRGTPALEQSAAIDAKEQRGCGVQMPITDRRAVK
jgi:hypothetical protein